MDVVTAQLENENLRKIRNRLLQWEGKTNPLAALSAQQEEFFEIIDTVCTEVSNDWDSSCSNDFEMVFQIPKTTENEHKSSTATGTTVEDATTSSLMKLQELSSPGIETTNDFLLWYNQVLDEIHENDDIHAEHYLQQLITRSTECSRILEQIEQAMQRLDKLKNEYSFVSQKTEALNTASEQLLEEQQKLQALGEEIQHRLHYFNQVESINHRLFSPTLSVASGSFQECLTKIDHCLTYIKEHPNFKDSPSFIIKYKQCLNKAISLMRNYVTTVMAQATEATLHPKQSLVSAGESPNTSPDATFALYYGKYQTSAAKIKRVSQLVESRVELCREYANLLGDIQQCYLSERSTIMTPAVDNAIKDIKSQHKAATLEAFATIANQLLQDVQERLVFRAHLYLQSDILNYNPSPGDLAYPDKLEMMESIALSLQDSYSQQMRRFDSRSSLASISSNVTEAESLDTNVSRVRNMNSPADLHGMWYPTVRRTLVCLSRLYRCVDRPIFQGLSQEALKLCIESVSVAAKKISQNKTPIDGELFEIKHLLILREQIAPFRVDFTVKETSLDFSKVKTAAFGLIQKRKQLFAIGSNNALLEFLLEGTPQIKEHLLDSRKEVDRQLKLVCEQFIKDAVQNLIGPLLTFLERANQLIQNDVKNSNDQQQQPTKVNYVLRQSAWASPQQTSSVIQETQRLIKSRLPNLQRSMQLYLSNRDTEFIIFRPIRNNVIQVFVKVEQLLTTNGYSKDDMTIASCPSAEQVSVLLSSASILAIESIANFSAAQGKLSRSSSEARPMSPQTPQTPIPITRKLSTEKKVSFEGPSGTSLVMENLQELSESSDGNSAIMASKNLSPAPLTDTVLKTNEHV
uniref:Conserved oligomeric Golgi complex subunit 3 n=1 Tax=Glossina brevipalpis TaxID=37001 RepID=A0A1A9WXK5_9MUSC